MSDRASVSIRFTGKRLGLNNITRLLGEEPTLSYHKGDMYRAGKSETARKALTDLWLFDTSKRYPDLNINEQIEYCVGLFIKTNTSTQEPITRIEQLISQYQAKLLISVYYFAKWGEDINLKVKDLEIITEHLGGKLHLEFDRETLEDVEHNKSLAIFERH